MADATLTITLADGAGDGESRWIRLEPVEPEDEGATMEQAAAVIDALFGIEPCTDGDMGEGGANADWEALPEEQEFLALARERIDLAACREDDFWTAEVDVLRSHRDDAYRLEVGAATITETVMVEKLVTETVEMDGATHDLALPYLGGIQVSGAGAELADVRGSTLNFSAPVKGRVRIRYRAAWERVTLRARRGEEAAIIAFWRDLATECTLREPPKDDHADAAEIRRICDAGKDLHVEGECWKTIERYNLCRCSGREAPDAPDPEDVDAPCPQDVRPGSFLGVERELGSYVDCEDGEGLNSPSAYYNRCCQEPPYDPVPSCRETREAYRGGAEIEYGPEHWKNIYGRSARLIAVPPPELNCGELIRVWNVPGERDCDDNPDNPDDPDRLPDPPPGRRGVDWNGPIWVQIRFPDGKNPGAPFNYSPHGGYRTYCPRRWISNGCQGGEFYVAYYNFNPSRREGYTVWDTVDIAMTRGRYGVVLSPWGGGANDYVSNYLAFMQDIIRAEMRYTTDRILRNSYKSMHYDGKEWHWESEDEYGNIRSYSGNLGPGLVANIYLTYVVYRQDGWGAGGWEPLYP